MPEIDNDPVGTQRVLADLEKRRRAAEEYIKDVLHHFETFSENELRMILLARDLAAAAVDACADEAKSRGLTETDPDLGRKYLARLEIALDQLPIWAAKFSTETSGGGVEGPMEIDPDKNSIYYVTPAGASMRLRRSSIEEGRGIREAAQPVAEKIYFEKQENGQFRELSLAPKLGFVVKEIFTGSFHKLLKQRQVENEHRSSIAIFEKDKKIYGFAAQDKDYDMHDGDRVNNIYW